MPLPNESLGEDVHKLGSSWHIVKGVGTVFKTLCWKFSAVVEFGVPSGGNDGVIVDGKGNGKSDWLVKAREESPKPGGLHAGMHANEVPGLGARSRLAVATQVRQYRTKVSPSVTPER